MQSARQNNPSDQILCDLFRKVTGSSWSEATSSTATTGTSVMIGEELELDRIILARLRSADPESRNVLSRNLTVLLIRDSGLRKLLSATFDFDETSQHVTTLDQRFQALANLVAFVPMICCPLEMYYKSLSTQIYSLFREDQNVTDSVMKSVQKVCTLIVNALLARKRQLATQTFVEPVLSALACPSGALSPQNCIDVVYGLTNADFDLNLIIKAFAGLLFIRCALESSPTVYKTRVSVVITEFLKRVENSAYLLDDSIFTHFQEYSKKYITSADEKGGICITFRISELDDETRLKSVADVVSAVMAMTADGLNEEQQVDFCLLLLDRLAVHHLMSADCALVLYTLVASFLEKIEPLFCKYPRKWIKFAGDTLSRLSSAVDPNPNIENSSTDHEGEKAAASALRTDSIGVVVQIIRTLVSERSRLHSEDVDALRGCLSQMEKLDSKTTGADEIDSLRQELEDLQSSDSPRNLSKMSSNSFREALRDLNDPMMPTRAHGLITVKRMIVTGDDEVLQNWKRVLQLLEMSLADSESYIYLSAINTLAALSAIKPDETIPILLRTYQDSDRTTQERLNVGEVIARVTRSLDDSAEKYAQQFFTAFMRTLEDSDELIRVSSLSNVGHLSSRLGPFLSPYVSELFRTVDNLIRTDPSLQVKRASLMVLHLTLTGIDGDSFEVIRQHGTRLHSLVQKTYASSPDDVSRLHAQLAIEEMDRIARDRLSTQLRGKPIPEAIK